MSRCPGSSADDRARALRPAFEVDGRILRVQCKWAGVLGAAVVVNLRTSYLTKTREVRAPYRADEVDAVAAYCEELDRCYLLPNGLVQGMCAIRLRLHPETGSERRYTGRPTTSFLGL